MIRMSFDLSGDLSAPEVLPWLQERVRRLSLTGEIRSLSPKRVRLTVQGHRDLVEALETACWLGPETAWIDDIQSNPQMPIAGETGVILTNGQ